MFYPSPQKYLLIAVLATLTAVANPTARAGDIVLNLEEPTANSVYTGVSNIRGWVVGSVGINRIELYVDGELKTNIPVGGWRPDVGNAYPSYPNSANSGYSMAFNYSELADGQHTIRVRAIDQNVVASEKTIAFNVTRFSNPYIPDPARVSLNGATITSDGRSIIINNMTADGTTYDLRLDWRTEMQNYTLTQIVSTGSPPPAGTSSSLTGRWRGTTWSRVYSDTSSFTMYLIQEGSTLRGSLTVPKDPHLINTNLTGNVSGNAITWGVVGQVQFTGTVSADGNTISGSFVSPNDDGTWQATRTP